MRRSTTAGVVGAGFLATTLVVGALAWAGCVRPGPEPAALRPRCGVSLLFLEPADAEGRIIDHATGRLGYSHVAVDGCEVDSAGVELVIECIPNAGVVRRPLQDFLGGRKHSRVQLPLVEGRELYGCARGRIGVPYNLLGIVVPRTGPSGGLICSQLVAECLPAALRQRLPTPTGRPIAPNDIARAFGLAGPDGPDTEIG